MVIHLSNQAFQESFLFNAGRNNETLTWSVASAAAPLFASIKQHAHPASQILETQAARQLGAVLKRDIQHPLIHTINIQGADGRIIYSTQPYLLNKTRPNPDFRAAVAGKTVTRYHPISQAQASGQRQVHHFFISYLPFANIGNGDSPGVISVQTDHSEDYRNSLRQQRRSALLIVAALMLIYSVIMLFVWRLYRRAQEKNQQLTHLKNQLQYNTLHDRLTGLPNRAKFTERVNVLAKDCARSPHQSFAVLLMDLDSFKVVNESLGHSSGNRLLKKVAKRVRSCLANEDFVARVGGDEFGIIVEHSPDVPQMIALAKRIHAQFQIPFKLKGHDIIESVSIGITICQGGELSSEEIIRDADIAMYRAKKGGRGRYELYNQHMHTEAVERIKREADIRRGLEAGEFFNRYQPIVDLNTGITHSLEALVRWAHPQQREISPEHFIALAEEMSLVQQIDQGVLSAAVDELVAWRCALPEVSDLSVNVNHSARNFHSRLGMDNILRTLERSGLQPGNLKIELTESSILNNEVMAFNLFEELRNKGVHLCMDDFGTGFSSLSYLHKLNFDMLKIDMSFVHDMLDSEEARKIVHTIIDMGEHLGISVTAEGVENQEQVDMLQSMGCRYAQGFYFAKPLRPTEVVPYIRTQLDAN